MDLIEQVGENLTLEKGYLLGLFHEIIFFLALLTYII